MLEKIKKTLTDTCILFTIFVFVILVINKIFSPPDEGIVVGLSLGTATLLFVCSLLLRAFHNILHIEKIPLGWRFLLNYLLVVGTAFIAIKLITALTNRQSNDLVSFLLLSVFTLIYSGVVIGLMLLKKKREEKKKEKEEYQPIVKKK